MTRVLKIEVLAPHHKPRGKLREVASWITSNDRTARFGVAARTAKWRRLAQEAIPEGASPFLGRVRIVASVWKPTDNRWDPGNWYPTAKACVDGIVDAGIIPDDNWRLVEGPDMRRGGQCARGRERIIITIEELTQ
jgi:hypothetical protein